MQNIISHFVIENIEFEIDHIFNLVIIAEAKCLLVVPYTGLLVELGKLLFVEIFYKLIKGRYKLQKMNMQVIILSLADTIWTMKLKSIFIF